MFGWNLHIYCVRSVGSQLMPGNTPTPPVLAMISPAPTPPWLNNCFNKNNCKFSTSINGYLCGKSCFILLPVWKDMLSLNVFHLVNTYWDFQSLKNHEGEKSPNSKISVIFFYLSILILSILIWDFVQVTKLLRLRLPRTRLEFLN